MRSFIYICTLLGSLLWAGPASSQSGGDLPGGGTASHPPASSVSGITPPRLIPSFFPAGGEVREPAFARATAHAAPSGAVLLEVGPRPGTYIWWGGAVGGAAGLTYGLLYGDNTIIEWSPMIETILGGGIGLLAGATIDLVQSMR